MKTPWRMEDYNKELAARGIKFRPVDVFDADGKKLFRISEGEDGMALAKKIIRCVNLVSEAAS